MSRQYVQPPAPASFSDDGCSYVPDKWLGWLLNPIDFSEACRRHDWAGWVIEHGTQLFDPSQRQFYVDGLDDYGRTQRIYLGRVRLTYKRSNRLFRKDCRTAAYRAGYGPFVAAIAGLVYAEATDRLQHRPRWLAITLVIALIATLLALLTLVVV